MIDKSSARCSLVLSRLSHNNVTKPSFHFFFFLLYNIILVLPHINMNLFPILNPPPTRLPVPSFWVIPVHQPQGSCIEPGLVIHFLCDIIHVSMTFLQIIPPSPSPRVQKTVLYICVSLEEKKATQSSILAWRIPWTVHGITKSWKQLSDFHFQLYVFLLLNYYLLFMSSLDYRNVRQKSKFKRFYIRVQTGS